MSGGTSPRPPFLQIHLAPLGFVALWCVVVGFLLATAATAALNEKSAFDAAPVCSSADNLSGCRYVGAGKVVRVYYVKGAPYLDVSPDALLAHYAAGFAPVDAGKVTTWEIGTTVAVEIWKGRLVSVGGVKSGSNPDLSVAAYMLPVGLTVGAVGALLAAIFVWRLMLFREVLRGRARKLAGEDPNVQVLPLTPSMRTYLESLASETPVWLSANPRRDLRRGVFLRESGPFCVDLVAVKGFRTAVVVSVGGRMLDSVVAGSAEGVKSQVGKVDYLPSSGELLALWDDRGGLLAARIPDTASELAAQSAAR